MGKATAISKAVIGAGAIWLATSPALAETTNVPRVLIERLCAGRKPCKLAGVEPAGRISTGRPITVIELSLGKQPRGRTVSNPRFGCRPHRREFWMISPGIPQRLLDLCNDGYGAAGLGEDVVDFDDNKLTHEQSGGSAWRWSNSKSIQLWPLRMRAQSRCSFHTAAPGFALKRWNWTRFRGQGAYAVTNRCRKPAPNEEQGACELGKAAGRFVLIPKIATEVEGAPHLGTCAAMIDASGKNGFVTLGKATGRKAPWVKALLISDRELLVTVADREFATGGPSWVHDDHLEIWQGLPLGTDKCGEAKKELRQWGLRVADARIFAAHGRAEALTVLARSRKQENGLTIASFRLRLEFKAEGLTVVYSKANRRRQRLMIATSRLKYRDPTSLGEAYPIPRGAARCVMQNGVLDVIQSGNFHAIIQSEK
ncbi:MAG TPA: hypothetical protein VM325_20640 [Alphaproteobacteria bacterium]|nr:hypothetical protein [Alphaproteobacteria bacterium]